MLFIALLVLPDLTATSAGFGLALTSLSVLACLEKLAIVMNTIAIERDWVVVVAGGSEATLNGRSNKRL